jgi:hypothetical protein
VGKRVKEIETDVKQRGKLQAAKDTSQVRVWRKTNEISLTHFSRCIDDCLPSP